MTNTNDHPIKIILNLDEIRAMPYDKKCVPDIYAPLEIATFPSVKAYSAFIKKWQDKIDIYKKRCEILEKHLDNYREFLCKNGSGGQKLANAHLGTLKQIRNICAGKWDYMSKAKIWAAAEGAIAGHEIIMKQAGQHKNTFDIIAKINDIFGKKYFDGTPEQQDINRKLLAVLAEYRKSLEECGPAGKDLTDESLRQLMCDPKYWRGHDPEYVRKIENGFKKLYGND